MEHSVTLPVLYRDDFLIAVDKPCGMLVHPGRDPEPREQIAMKVLRDQLGGQYVYTVHRLDRPTSGVLLFALSPEVESLMKGQFAERSVGKEYLVLVEGQTEAAWECHEPLAKDDTEKARECTTRFRRLAEWPPFSDGPPLSLLEARPLTGRMHQIRKHLAFGGHLLLGDYLYGDHARNDAFAEYLGQSRLMLHSWALDVDHPASGDRLRIEAPAPEGFGMPQDRANPTSET